MALKLNTASAVSHPRYTRTILTVFLVFATAVWAILFFGCFSGGELPGVFVAELRAPVDEELGQRPTSMVVRLGYFGLCVGPGTFSCLRTSWTSAGNTIISGSVADLQVARMFAQNGGFVLSALSLQAGAPVLALLLTGVLLLAALAFFSLDYLLSLSRGARLATACACLARRLELAAATMAVAAAVAFTQDSRTQRQAARFALATPLEYASGKTALALHWLVPVLVLISILGKAAATGRDILSSPQQRRPKKDVEVGFLSTGYSAVPMRSPMVASPTAPTVPTTSPPSSRLNRFPNER